MHESLGVAKDEIRRLREVEAGGVSDKELLQQRTMQNDELKDMRIKLEQQVVRLQEDVRRLEEELKESRDIARRAGDRVAAEAAAAAIARQREEKCAGELVVVRRQVRAC
jgi:hypothetical protein